MAGTAALRLSRELRTQPARSPPARHGGDRSDTTRSYVPGISQTSSTRSLTTCDLVSHDQPDLRGGVGQRLPGRARIEVPVSDHALCCLQCLVGIPVVPGRPPYGAQRGEGVGLRNYGQQPGGVLAGDPVDAPLQVADRPGSAGRLGQLLLRQPRLGPPPPQQPAETRRRLLGHGPSSPHTTPPPSAPFTRAPDTALPQA